MKNVADLSKTLQANPDDYGAACTLGSLLLEYGNDELSLVCFNHASRIKQSMASPFFGVSLALRGEGKFVEAFKDKLALSLYNDPANFKARTQLALNQFFDCEDVSALGNLVEVLEANPRFVPALVVAGELLR